MLPSLEFHIRKSLIFLQSVSLLGTGDASFKLCGMIRWHTLTTGSAVKFRSKYAMSSVALPCSLEYFIPMLAVPECQCRCVKQVKKKERSKDRRGVVLCDVYSYFEKGCRKKICTRQSRKIIWDMINKLFLALANIRPWPLVPFFQISLKKNRELKTTHNAFRNCRVHFFPQPFWK